MERMTTPKQREQTAREAAEAACAKLAAFEGWTSAPVKEGCFIAGFLAGAAWGRERALEEAAGMVEAELAEWSAPSNGARAACMSILKAIRAASEGT